MISKFLNDKKLEELFSQFLDENFYEKLVKEQLILDWYRVNEEELQKQGKDVILVVSATEEKIIDEKATLHYINKDIPTFAFEIINQQSGKIGWLFDDEKETEYYLLAWPNGNEINERKVDFISSKILLIKRINVIKLLEEHGLDKVKIFELTRKYSDIATPCCNKFTLADGVKLNFNFRLHERPINLVISRRLLIEKSDFYIFIKKNQMFNIENLKF